MIVFHHADDKESDVQSKDPSQSSVFLPNSFSDRLALSQKYSKIVFKPLMTLPRINKTELMIHLWGAS